MARKTYTTEFKREAAAMVLDQGCGIRQTCEAMGVGATALRRWVKQLRDERAGITPTTSAALTAEQQEIQRLQKELRRLERANDILKKATALLMSDTLKNGV